MSYQMEFKDKGASDASWSKWAKKYPTREALDADWGKDQVLNTDEFDFRVVENKEN